MEGFHEQRISTDTHPAQERARHQPEGGRLLSARFPGLQSEVKEGLEKTNNVEAAAKLGEVIAKKALDNGINEVVFDRGGYIYQGKVKALADAAREAGLQF